MTSLPVKQEKKNICGLINGRMMDETNRKLLNNDDIPSEENVKKIVKMTVESVMKLIENY